MILKAHKHFTCDYNFVIKASLLLSFIFCKPYFGQDTVLLKKVEVTAKKIALSQIGKKTEEIDSTIKAHFKFNSIADVLSLNTPIFVKNYGPGAVATTAFRGGNASQTAILWNGFNIQHPMLGQSDLALITASLFENISVEYGGSSSLWGSGAVGGSIHLKNSHLFDQGLKTSASIGAGSFGLKNSSASAEYSKRRFISSSKIYNSRSTNNFNYKDTTDKEQPIKQQQNASYNFIGLMQEFKFLINPKQILSINAWINTNQRRLPDYNQSQESKIYQKDAATRITANWSFITANFKSNIRGAFFEEKINYTDSLSAVFSKSKSQTFIAENENYISVNENHQLNFGINFSSSSAITNNYASTKILNKVSFLLGDKLSYFKDKWLTYISARADYFSVGALPITGNISTEYHLTNNIVMMASAAKVYRQPTLNELYWLPGGNSSLKPEEGYTYEGAINYHRQINNLWIYASGAAFSRQINNWILWIPAASGNPSPVNLQTVWSRGTETTLKTKYVKNKFRCQLAFVTGYVLATVRANQQENNNTINKQLIYTPRYTANANVLVSYDNTALTFFSQYIGYRYTTSDNLQWLNPYTISSIRLNHTIKTKFMNFSLFAACNNLFNYNYTLLTGRPMPLRNYEFGITIQTTTKNKKTI